MAGDPDELLAPKEIRRLLKISERTFHRWDKDGILPPPYVVIGSARRWRRWEFEQWLQQRVEETRKLPPAEKRQSTPKAAKARQKTPTPSEPTNEP